MKPRPILIRTLEVMTTSRLGQVQSGTQTKGVGARARHQALSWFATVFVLGITDLACRNPAEEPYKAVVQIPRPQLEPTAKAVDTRVARAGQLADQSVQSQAPTAAEMNGRKDAGQNSKDKVVESDKAGNVPLSSGGKGVIASPLAQPTDAAKDSKTLRPITEHPANQAARIQVAGSDKARGEAVSPGGKDVEVLTSTAKAAQAAKGSEAMHANTKSPANPAALAQVAGSDKARGEPVSSGGKDAKTLTPTAKATQAAKGSEAMHANAKSPANQAALAQVALSDNDWTVRKAAVEGLTNQGVLAQVAMSDEDLDIRKLAVSRLTAQAALAKVATSDKDWSVRRAATAMLTEQGVLANIALVDTDSDIRKLAVSLLTDQAALARVARSDKDWSVRKSAVNKLTSRSSLAQVATSDKDPDIRKLAVSRLIDQTTTREADLDN